MRGEQFGTTPAETLDAAQALMFVDISKIEEFRTSMKTVLVKRSDEYDRFDRLFDSYWLTKFPGRSKNPLGRISTGELKRVERQLGSKQVQTNNQIGRGRITAGSLLTSRSSNASDSDRMFGIYSPLETPSQKRFDDLEVAKDRSLLKRAMRTFARANSTRPGRRFRRSQKEEEFMDFRATMRNSLRTGGKEFDIRLRERYLSKSRLVVLCDISGSMDAYSSTVLKLMYHLCNTVRGTKIFGFSTCIVPLDRFLQGRSLGEALRLVSENVDIWSSGTRIGSALGDLLTNYGGFLRSTTVFVIISDGWELGDLEVLKSRLAAIRSRVNGIIWLNPQADSPDYVPLAEGMKSSLPYTDVFAGLDIFSNRAKFRKAFHSKAPLA